MYKRLVIIFLIFMSIFSCIFAVEDEISKDDAIKYNKTVYNSYLVLIGILIIGIAITLLLIQHNYGFKHMFQILGFIVFVLILFWLFRIAKF